MTASYVNPVTGAAFLTHHDLLIVLEALAIAVLWATATGHPERIDAFRALQRTLSDD